MPKGIVIDRPKAEILAELGKRGLLPIITGIALENHVLVDEVVQDIRTPAVVAARDAFMNYLYNVGWSTTEIGKLFHRNHSTVLAALHRWWNT